MLASFLFAERSTRDEGQLPTRNERSCICQRGVDLRCWYRFCDLNLCSADFYNRSTATPGSAPCLISRAEERAMAQVGSAVSGQRLEGISMKEWISFGHVSSRGTSCRNFASWGHWHVKGLRTMIFLKRGFLQATHRLKEERHFWHVFNCHESVSTTVPRLFLCRKGVPAALFIVPASCSSVPMEVLVDCKYCTSFLYVAFPRWNARRTTL